MLLWNYLIAPVYMEYPREEIIKLLPTVFLPFNLVKGGLNAAITMLVYKPVVTVMRRIGMVEPEHTRKGMRFHAGVVFAAVGIIITCVLIILSMNGIL